MDLRKLATNIRINIIKMLHEAGSGHTGGSLGMTDVFTVLYFKVLKDIHTTKEDRDRFILSNGHICPVWYATLAEKGFLKKEELMTLRKTGSRLEGHPVNHNFRFAELATGSLGQGLSAAVGLALGYKLDNKKCYIYASIGDGEMQEGSVWEALMAAGHYKLNNLIVFVDRNYVQQAGKTEEMMSLDPLKDKVIAFKWSVIEADGHNFEDIERVFKQAKESSKPCFIIFRTHMGQGVSYVLDNFNWHGKAPNDDQAKQALKELANV